MSRQAIHFAGPDFILDPEDISAEFLEDLKDCGAGGQDASPAVDYVISRYAITGDPEDCRNMLRGYNAWEDEDLEDHDENLRRLVWLTGCSLSEGEPAYFSTY